MSPLLNRESSRQIVVGLYFKFATDSGQIGFEKLEKWDSVFPMHAEVARKNGLGDLISRDSYERQVDDAGNLTRQENGRLLFHYQSNSCFPRDPNLSRIITQKLAQELTGEPVDIELPSWHRY